MKFDRYKDNPILSPNNKNQWENLCVLNPAVCYDEKTHKFVMLYRAAGDDIKHKIRIGLATSDDGYHFERMSDQPVLDGQDYEPDGGCLEDPRIVNIDGRYYITYASRAFAPGQYWLPIDEYMEQRKQWMGEHPDSSPVFIKTNHTITYLAYTDDFITYKKLGRITDSRLDDRDVVIFPRKINGKFYMISRPVIDEDRSMWISSSDDLLEWSNRVKLYSGIEDWENSRLGAGCPPIETDEGWLLIYHGVSKADMNYRTGIMLLDKEDPTKILAKSKDFVMQPETDYEKSGLYNGCVFPTGAVVKDGLLYVYYGCADKFVAVATKPISEVMNYLAENKM